jgi:hypothetical protein
LKSLLCISQTGRSTRKWDQCSNHFNVFHEQVGRLKQLNHFWEIFEFFTPSRRSSKTIRLFLKNLCNFYQRVSHAEQLDHFKKKSLNFSTWAGRLKQLYIFWKSLSYSLTMYIACQMTNFKILVFLEEGCLSNEYF